MQGAEPILKLSIATQMDLKTASDLVTDSLSAMKMEVKDLPHYLDVVARAQSLTNTEAEDLMKAFLKCGNTAENLKIPLEETSAALGIFANNGLKGSLAGTKLNRILIRMTAQSGPAAEAWAKMGVKVYDNQGKFRGLTTVLGEARKSLSKMNQEQQMMILKQAVTADNVVAFKQLLDATDGTLQGLTTELQNSDGALEELRKTMEDTTKNKIDQMKSAIEEGMIATFQALAPVITDLALGIKSLADWFGKLDEGTQRLIAFTGLALAAAGPLASLAGGIMKAGSMAGKAVKGFDAFITGLTGVGKATKTASGAMEAVSVASDVAGTAMAGKTAKVAKSVATDQKAAAGALRHAKSMQTAAKNATKMAAAGKLSRDSAMAMAMAAAGATSKAETLARGLQKTSTTTGRTAKTMVRFSGTIKNNMISPINLGVRQATKLNSTFGKIGRAAVGAGGGILSLGKKILSLGGLINPVTGGIIAGVTAVGYAFAKGNEKVSKSVDLFADGLVPVAGAVGGEMVKISEKTKEAVGAYMKLDKQAQQGLMNVYMSGKKVNSAIAGEQIKTLKQMGEMQTTELKNQHKKHMEVLMSSGLERYGIGVEQQSKAMKFLRKSHAEELEEIDKKVKREMEIWNKASEGKRALTEKEFNELTEIRKQMAENAVTVLTQQEEEQNLILARMGQYQGHITAEMAADWVKKLNEQRDKVVEQAELQYQEQIKIAEKIRSEGSKEAQTLADNIVKAAERQKKETIEKANQTKQQGIDKLKTAYGDLENKVNTSTGQILTMWERLKVWWEKWNPQPKTMTVKTYTENTVVNKYSSQGQGTGFQKQGAKVTTAAQNQPSKYSMSGRAKGGTIYGSGWSLVGENGPELMHQSQGRTKVYPLTSQESRGGAPRLGGGSNINIEKMVVRDDTDIRKIATELDRLQDSDNFNQGKVKYF